MTDVDDLSELIAHAANRPSAIARRIIAAGWSRTPTVDDAMIERARSVLVLAHPETVRAALTAALTPTEPSPAGDKTTKMPRPRGPVSQSSVAAPPAGESTNPDTHTLVCSCGKVYRYDEDPHPWPAPLCAECGRSRGWHTDADPPPSHPYRADHIEGDTHE